ncbi:hypothetical protein [Micromonospora sp. NPDC005324]|uniref:hypothetical protein n=1 Tax=Micromonospora sp. NPDC005324 TaxID=3157033 RepID=UPI0033B51F93
MPRLPVGTDWPTAGASPLPFIFSVDCAALPRSRPSPGGRRPARSFVDQAAGYPDLRCLAAAGPEESMLT